MVQHHPNGSFIDVEVVPIPIQNKRRGRPPGSKNKKKH